MDIVTMVIVIFITLILVAKVFSEDEKSKNEDEVTNNTDEAVKK